MSNAVITWLVVAACTIVGLLAYVTLVLIPAWQSYTRTWERIAAAFLSVYVLLTFMGLGAAGGLALAWFWDNIQG
jgi:membrane protein insertase Oxa1/YidC/SpoIIIJ